MLVSFIIDFTKLCIKLVSKLTACSTGWRKSPSYSPHFLNYDTPLYRYPFSSYTVVGQGGMASSPHLKGISPMIPHLPKGNSPSWSTAWLQLGLEEEGFIQKRRQRSSVLFGGRIWMPHKPFSSKDFWKKVFENIHFRRVVVWCCVNWKIIHFSEASIPPSVHFSIHSFLQIILVQNS